MSQATPEDAEPVNIFEYGSPLEAGDVVLVFTGTLSPRDVLAEWLRLIAFPARDKSAAALIVAGLRPDIAGPHNIRAYLANIQEKLSASWSEPTVVELPTEDMSTALGSLPFAVEKAVVCLVDIERLRSEFAEPEGEAIETVDGTRVRSWEKDELNLKHITHATGVVCTEALKSGQRWLLLARGFGFGGDVPEALGHAPNLSVIEMSSTPGTDPSIEFRRILRDVAKSGPDAALRWVSEKFHGPKLPAIARANILAAAGQPERAFQEIKPVADLVVRDGLAYEVLQLVQFSAAAGARSDAVRWLCALPSLATSPFELVRSAWLLASNLDVAAVVDACRTQLRRRFPNHTFTKVELYYERLEADDFNTAVAIATDLGDPFRIELARFFQSADFSPGALIAASLNTGEESVAIWHVARVAEHRKLFTDARDFAARLAGDKTYGGKAIALRVRILIQQAPALETDAFAAELADIIRWCATRPAELDARFALEGMYESVTTERRAIATTVILLNQELERVAGVAAAVSPQEKSLIEAELENPDYDTIAEMMKSAILLANEGQLVAGLGSFAPDLEAKVTTKLMSDLGKFLQFNSENPDRIISPVLLHTIILVARSLNDPTSDLIAARMITPQLTQVGPPQAALDLAESLMFILPSNQPAHRPWRMSISWAVYADVSLRLHNPLAALRFLAFALSSLQEPPLHVGLFAELLRLCARVTRELGITPLSQIFAERERQFLRPFPSYEHRVQQLQQVDLVTRLKEWDASQGPDPLHAIARSAMLLLEQGPPGGEIAPLYSALANAVRFLRLVGMPVPTDIESSNQRWFEKLPEEHKGKLLAVATGQPSPENLRALANRSLRYSDDWSHSLLPAVVAAQAALAPACAAGNVELFWTACTILCQPGLGRRIVERAHGNEFADPVAATRWMAQQIETGATRPVDAMQIQRRLGSVPNDTSVPNLFDVSLQDFCTLLLPDESVVLLVSDEAKIAYRCQITREGAAPPIQLEREAWDPDQMSEWEKSYPAKHGHDLKIYFGHLRSPPPDEVNSAFERLRPLTGLTGKKVTVISEARLFGFSHRLAADITGGIDHVVVSPAPEWLAHMRKTVQPTPTTREAWLGSPKTKDEVLLALRDLLTPRLVDQGIAMIDADILPPLHDRGLVILASHGSAEQGHGFSRVSDDEQSYEPDEIATSLADTTCVVLFVCHAGRGDERLYSHETTGLVSSLLRRGIRAVVAPLWPLEITIADAWMEAFGRTSKDLTIVERVDQAQREIAKQPRFTDAYGEHPLIRNTFSVFGDGSVKLPS